LVTLKVVICFALAYLLGSIPTAYWAGRLLRGIDIRQHGSRNVGATNAVRVLGPGIGTAVLCIDIAKGFLAVQLGAWAALPQWTTVLAGLVAIAGHNWTCFLSFRGGKGVATSTGVFCALVPWALFAAFGTFILAVSLTRYVSLGSILGAIVLAGTATVQRVFQLGDQPQLLTLAVTWLVAFLVVMRHRANIERLRQGTESRFSLRGSTPKPPNNSPSEPPSAPD